jgi:hypothetical protein
MSAILISIDRIDTKLQKKIKGTNMDNTVENTSELRRFALDKMESALFGIAQTANLDFHPDIANLKEKLSFAVVVG